MHVNSDPLPEGPEGGAQLHGGFVEPGPAHRLVAQESSKPKVGYHVCKDESLLKLFDLQSGHNILIFSLSFYFIILIYLSYILSLYLFRSVRK